MPSGAGAGTTGEQIVTEAKTLLGDPYVYGAEGPSSFDCSGLVQFVYGKFGIKVPRVSSEQYTAGTPVQFSQLAPGDLVFSEWPGDDVAHHGHVAIYAGDGKIIEAPHPGGNVQLVPLNEYYKQHVDGYVRPKGLSGATGTTGTPTGTAGFDIPNPLDLLGGAGGLLSFPGEIINFFGEALKSLTSTFNFFAAFFRVSTYIRIAAGFFGLIFLAFGLHFLSQEARRG